MFKLHKINPMVRAVGTMGAVAAIAGGITFAQIPSNTVTLQNNTLTSATAHLQIAADHPCTDASDGPVQGMTFNNLLPGTPSSNFAFCLDNTGNTPLAITVSTPTTFSGDIAPTDVTLHFTCGVGGATTGAVDVSETLADLATPVNFGNNPLNNDTNNVYSCDVNATLANTVNTSNASVTPFDLDFNGSTVES